MGVLNDCEQFFGTGDLYEVLSVSKMASAKEIKKAYHKLSLKVHPDRVAESGKANATKQFQVLSTVYFVLSDEEKKAVYDETGIVEDENETLPDGRSWEEYWRHLFPKMTLADIEKYMEKYRGSKEETEDLKEYYLRFEGDLDKISEQMPGYEIAEEDRYKEILHSLVKSKELPSFSKFFKETSVKSNKRRKKYEGEAEEAAAARKELGLDGEDSLIKAISRRQAVRENDFDSLMSSLEQKYVKPRQTRKNTKKSKT